MKWFRFTGDEEAGRGPITPGSLLFHLDSSCTLSWETRLYGFAGCVIFGFLLGIFSIFTILQPVKYAVLYTTGNVLSLCGMMFLAGPAKQCKSMFMEKRIVATLVYLASMLLTLVVVFAWGKAKGYRLVPVILLLLAFQFCAMVWYTASYVPYARWMIKNCFRGFLG